LQDAVRFEDTSMATVPQQNPYQCDQCGTANIVAVPLLYEQGTRTYSGTFHRGSSQSYSAQVAAPPRPQRYTRPLLLWGFPTFLFAIWSYAGLRSILEHPRATATTANEVCVFIVLGLACFGALALNYRKIYRYNRKVYPQLHWDWEHTYMCRRCGSFRLISS